MQLIKSFFSGLIFQPLYNALILLCVFIPDLGIAILVLTVIIRLLMMPMVKKSIQSQKKMQEIQPKIKAIQEKYKHDRQLQGQKVMEFYKENKINPASGCLPIIFQLIIFIALYQVLLKVIGEDVDRSLLYSFVHAPEKINHVFLGLLNLSQPNILLTVVAAFLQFVQSKMMLGKKKLAEVPKEPAKEPDFSSALQTQMVYMGPIITLIIGLKFPSGLMLYWLATTVFMIVQQYLVLKKDGHSLKEMARSLF